MEFSFDVMSCVIAFGIAVSGAVVQGSVGFRLGLIGVLLLVLIDPVFVPGPLLLAESFGFPSRAYSDRFFWSEMCSWPGPCRGLWEPPPPS